MRGQWHLCFGEVLCRAFLHCKNKTRWPSKPVRVFNIFNKVSLYSHEASSIISRALRLWGCELKGYGSLWSRCCLNADHASTGTRPWKTCRDTCSGQSLTCNFFSQFTSTNFSQVPSMQGHIWEYLTSNAYKHPLLLEPSLWHRVLLAFFCLSATLWPSLLVHVLLLSLNFSTPLGLLLSPLNITLDNLMHILSSQIQLILEKKFSVIVY